MGSASAIARFVLPRETNAIPSRTRRAEVICRHQRAGVMLDRRVRHVQHERLFARPLTVFERHRMR